MHYIHVSLYICNAKLNYLHILIIIFIQSILKIQTNKLKNMKNYQIKDVETLIEDLETVSDLYDLDEFTDDQIALFREKLSELNNPTLNKFFNLKLTT